MTKALKLIRVSLTDGGEVMPINLFTSFAEEDREQLESFRALAKNPRHRLKFHDRSQLKPVLDKRGEPVRQPPNHPASKPIRDQLHPLLDRATKFTVLVGETTHEHPWVNWEIRTFFDKKKKLSGKTESRLIAMRLKGHRKAKLPKAVLDLGIQAINWNPEAFSNWLNANPDQQLPTLPLLFQ